MSLSARWGAPPPTPTGPRHPPGPADVAGLNSHDIPTFASFWRGLDIEDRRDLGLLDGESAPLEAKDRQGLRKALVAYLKAQGRLGDDPSDRQVLAEWLKIIAESEAAAVVVNLEDLWLETLPQNSPGVGPDRRPSWRRRARFTLEEIQRMPGVLDLLRVVDAARKGRR